MFFGSIELLQGKRIQKPVASKESRLSGLYFSSMIPLEGREDSSSQNGDGDQVIDLTHDQ